MRQDWARQKILFSAMVLQKSMETVKGLKPSLISSAHLARFVSKHRLRKEGKFARPLAPPVAGAIF